MKTSTFTIALLVAMVLVASACKGISDGEQLLTDGYELQLDGNLEEAIDKYNESIELEPALADTHFQRGSAFEALGRLQKAIESYDEAINLDPE